jgi:ribosome-associated heat shock protein Hsp15
MAEVRQPMQRRDPPSPSTAAATRLDIWLDVACLCKTRSQAQSACKKGRVTVNGAHGKPHRTVRPGDEIQIAAPGGWKRIVVVLDIETRSVPKARARQLYEDRTPKPSEEEMELRRLQRLAAPPRREVGAGAPKKKERRQLRRIKEG